MKLAIEHVPTIAVITATGGPRIDEQDLFARAVAELLDQSVRNIVLDLTEAVGIDSNTIGDMVTAQITATEQSAALAVVIPHDHFTDPPFEPSPVFDLYDSRAEAIEALMLKAASSRIQAETNRIAAEKSRRALLLFRLSYVVLLIGGLMLLGAILG